MCAKMAASSMLSRSCVKVVAGLPALGAAKVKTSSSSPFLAARLTQAERRRLVVSAKQDTPLVSASHSYNAWIHISSA